MILRLRESKRMKKRKKIGDNIIINSAFEALRPSQSARQPLGIKKAQFSFVIFGCNQLNIHETFKTKGTHSLLRVTNAIQRSSALPSIPNITQTFIKALHLFRSKFFISKIFFEIFFKYLFFPKKSSFRGVKYSLSNGIYFRVIKKNTNLFTVLIPVINIQKILLCKAKTVNKYKQG